MKKAGDNTIWLDIETGGTNPAQSSILSAAWGKTGNIKSHFAAPIEGSFLSEFSEKNIIPQLTSAVKSGKDILEEKQLIETLITELEADRGAAIAGFNIRGFDFGFIQRRARIYGMEARFTSALVGRPYVDPIHQVKNVIASSILEHAEGGLFNQTLGVSSWQEAGEKYADLPFKKRPVEYNLISSIEGYLKSGRDGAQFKGWKLEDVNRLLEVHSRAKTLQGGAAHEAAADLIMSRRVIDATKSGELREALKRPEIASEWLNITKSRGFHQFGGGRLLTQADIGSLAPGRAETKFIKSNWKLALAAGATAIIAASIFSAHDDNYNTIEGLPHGNFAQSKRLELTEFGSGWKGASSLRRAERLYKSMIKSTLSEAGHKGKINWMSHVDEDSGEMVLAARNAAGERLMGVQRTFSKESVDLTSIEVAPHLQGGIGRKFYEYENRALKRLGLSGAEVTSPVANPVTGRMQAELYGSKPMSMFNRDIESAYGVDPQEFQQMLMDKRMTKDQWKTMGLAPTFSGRVSAPKVNPIMSGKDDAHNSIEGLGHKGIGQRLRKLLTPFGSGFDALRGLAKGRETFQQMLSSTGFQKAMSSASHLKELASGHMGTAHLMEASFRGKQFQFVRKTGMLGSDEVSTMKALQNDFAPSVYSSSSSHIDMELFQGKTFREVIEAGEATPEHFRAIKENARIMESKGFAHGDYHKGNIMVTPEGRVTAIDFGAAGPIGSSGETAFKTSTGEIQRGFYGGYRKNASGELVEESIEVRSAAYDQGRIAQMEHFYKKRQSFANASTQKKIKEVETINEQTSLVATKKLSRAQLQRSSSESTWKAGKNGGRRSKME